MSPVVVVPTEPVHAEFVAAYIRREDAAECQAMGMTPREAIVQAVNASMIAETALVFGTPAACWGLVPGTLLGGNAAVWMLTTDEARRHPKALLRLSRQFVQECLTLYSTLECLTDLRYHQAVRWVQWLGFRETHIVPSRDAAMRRFEITRED